MYYIALQTKYLQIEALNDSKKHDVLSVCFPHYAESGRCKWPATTDHSGGRHKHCCLDAQVNSMLSNKLQVFINTCLKISWRSDGQRRWRMENCVHEPNKIPSLRKLPEESGGGLDTPQQTSPARLWTGMHQERKIGQQKVTWRCSVEDSMDNMGYLHLYLFVYATWSRWLEINDVCGRLRFVSYWLVVIDVFLGGRGWRGALKAGRFFRFTVLLSKWFHSTAVLMKKEFLCCLVLQGLISRLLLLFLV